MTNTEKISEIKNLIEEWGITNCFELGIKPPCITTTGDGEKVVKEVVESFYLDGVEIVTYKNNVQLDWDNVDYEDLSDDVIDEIYDIIEQYGGLMIKTMKRCEN
jgi:hypothetical protein